MTVNSSAVVRRNCASAKAGQVPGAKVGRAWVFSEGSDYGWTGIDYQIQNARYAAPDYQVL